MQLRRKGFTLIELLVVVAIIALLVSILLPALNGARRQAKAAVCLTHLRNQGTASAFYQQENSGWIPCGILSNASPTATQQPSNYTEWALPHQLFLKYLGYTPPGDGLKAQRMKIENLYSSGFNAAQRERMAEAYSTMVDYQCPEFPLVTAAPEGRVITSTADLDYVVNAMPIPFSPRSARASQSAGLEPDVDGNGAAGVLVASTDYYGLRRDSSIKRAADYIYITEVNSSVIENNLTSTEGYNFRFHHFFTGSHLPYAGTPRIASDKRHSGGLNALFFDGHADTLSPNEIDPGWPNSLALRLRWFSDPSELPRRFQ